MTAAMPEALVLGTLLELEQNARRCETVAELGFVMVNETLRLTPYRQAIFWARDPGGKIRIKAVSGTDSLDARAPFIIHMEGILKNLVVSPATASGRKTKPVSADALEDTHRKHWEKWSLAHGCWGPLLPPDLNLAGGLFFTRDTPFTDGETVILERLLDAYAYSLWALQNHRHPLGRKIGATIRKRAVRLAMAAVLLAALFMPVRLSALAPVEIVPRDPVLVSSPLDGVVKKLHVKPNQQVQKGDLLFSLEDTDTRNAYAVSLKTLAVVKAEYTEAVQKAFQDNESRAQIRMLKAEVDQKTSEVQYAMEVLQLSRVTAMQDGVAVFSDREDWLGKPVAVGEKVMTIANPDLVEAEIMLPVADAINLEQGADVKIFLNTKPDRPLAAELISANYEANVTPLGELAFKMRAALTSDKVPRIGLRGTAKVYGRRVTLFYYLMRRPLTALRIALGV